MPNNQSPYQTLVPVPPMGWKLRQEGPVLLLGSCFTENMGERLVQSGFRCMKNPFGILYNPLSMAEALSRCLDNRPIGEGQLVNHNGLWHSWLHHGSFSCAEKQECMDRCNQSIAEAHEFLKECDVIMLTFGTAFLYELTDAQFAPNVVGNCHKLPAQYFQKRMAGVDEIVSVWQSLLGRLRALPSPPKVLFTISPIRHWADGAHGNQLSKSTLLLAVDRLVGECCDYFPAYEIMMDELRDYRFYADDMLHPSALAEEVIWNRLQSALMDMPTIELGKKYQQLSRLQGHRPMNPQSSEYAKYEARILALKEEINKKSNK